MIKSIKGFFQGASTVKSGYDQMNAIKKAAAKGGYYEHIDELPLRNFFKIKKGEYKYLWIKDIEKPFNKYLFMGVFQQMHFQFNHLDNEYLREKALAAEYESKSIRAKTQADKVRWRNNYTTQQKKVDDWAVSDIEIDDFTDYIERTYGLAPGAIDIDKISTSKGFNSFHKAIEVNKKRESNKRKK